jgi:hypothetical protein
MHYGSKVELEHHGRIWVAGGESAGGARRKRAAAGGGREVIVGDALGAAWKTRQVNILLFLVLFLHLKY